MAHSVLLPDGQPCAGMQWCLDFACLFHSPQSTIFPAARQVALEHLPASSEGRRFFFSTSAIPSWRIFKKLFVLNLSWGAAGCSPVISQQTGFYWDVSSDLAEMIFCNVKILQKAVCMSAMLFPDAQGSHHGGGGFFLCIASQRWRWSGWMRRHPKWERF